MVDTAGVTTPPQEVHAGRPPHPFGHLNHRVLLGGLPVAVFWFANRAGPVELAIALSFLASAFVFFANRDSGVIRALAVLSFATVAGSATVGLIIGSGKAFVAENIVGDFVIIGVAIGSLAIGKPLSGAVVRELAPVVRSALAIDHRAFIYLTLIFIGVNIATGIIRIFMLMHLSADDYIIASRVMTWPFNLVFLGSAYFLVTRAMRDSGALGAVPSPAPSTA